VKNVTFNFIIFYFFTQLYESKKVVIFNKKKLFLTSLSPFSWETG